MSDTSTGATAPETSTGATGTETSTDALAPGRIAFLGCGSMNGAILTGLLAGGMDPAAVTATVRRAGRAEELAARHGLRVLAGEDNPQANAQAAEGADVVVLGVKPVGTAALAREIAGVLSPGTIVISIAAGVSLAQLEAALNPGQPVVRAMPNTPARLGRGVIALSRGAAADDAVMAAATAVLAPSGTVLEVPGDQIDLVSAISGSGPAYAFYLAEAMAAAARDFGIDADTALLMARETVAGAGALLAEPGADPTALRQAVSSPNGTTERAIAVFDEQGLSGIIAAGARAAAARAAEITLELDNQ